MINAYYNNLIRHKNKSASDFSSVELQFFVKLKNGTLMLENKM